MNRKEIQNSSSPVKLRLILIYILFVLINISVNRLVKALGLPLYVDNIGTLSGAVLGGYLPGIFIGYITNIINSTADITNLYYAGISALIAITATFLARKGFYEKFWKALLTVPALAFIGGVIGSLLTWYIYGPGELSLGMQIWADFKLDLIDKAITVAGFYIFSKLMPQSITKLLELTDWRQRPLNSREIDIVKKTTTRKMPLRAKLTVIVCIIMVFGTFVTTAISFLLYKNFSIEQYTTIGKNVARMAAITLDPDRIDDYLIEGNGSEDYKHTEKDLYEIKESAPYIEYIYIYKILPDGCHVIFDLDTTDLPGAELGEVVPFDESFEDYLPQLLAGQPIDPVITDDTYGWLLTDYEPVYDSKGNCVCYACTDINMRDVRTNGISFLAKIFSLFSGFFLLILTLCLWFSDFHLIYPIDAMTIAAGKFAYDKDSDLSADVQQLKDLTISTGDEIENLYNVLVKTISETVGYLDEVATKGAQIERMQNGLIYILADLVESRDKCTGDHVRKTAAYVELILQLLRENNEFQEYITDEYAKSVINSAPLHDVGKIKVSDVILNKPSRLTDEEFEQMKNHTTAGKEIIESAMALTDDPGYLSEALNLATYHHEKWDGSGYPRGLKGEEIPLSARIMAVSDVFDALVSTRSYKKPFTFEQAMKIIEEGAGTHFDPVIAKLFVENADRVRAIAQEHNSRNAQITNDT